MCVCVGFQVSIGLIDTCEEKRGIYAFFIDMSLLCNVLRAMGIIKWG